MPYSIATASPSSLLLAGIVAGVLLSNIVGLLADAIRARRHG